jgi:putative CocE/NonD family hydrolase
VSEAQKANLAAAKTLRTRATALLLATLTIFSGVAGAAAGADDQALQKLGEAARKTTFTLQQQFPWISKSNREEMAITDGNALGPDFTQWFSKSVTWILMRDGTKLHTEIYAPRNQTEPLPLILVRTPYGFGRDKYGYAAWLREYMHLMKDGYIFVFQDTRGRGGSSGQYVTLSGMRDKSVRNSTDESTDAYDTIDWIVKNVPRNNGRVGMLGTSYGGYLTARALVDPHPALKAASPQAPCVDMFIGDDFHHNGAFRLGYAFAFIAEMEGGNTHSAALARYDEYDRFLELGPLSNVNSQIFHGKAPSWNAFVAHPNLDRYWTNDMCSLLPHIQPVTVPTLNVGGWFDAEDFYGTIEAYRKYEQADKRGLNYLVIGPWYHQGWNFGDGRTLGEIEFGSDTAVWYRENVEAPWFAYWLKDKGKLALPKVLAFRTGANVWEHFDTWPPRTGIKDANIYLRAGGKLSFDPPTDGHDARDQYVSDPSKPVPYRPRPITSNGWPEWEMGDQRFVDGRPDVLTYQMEPLTKDVTVSGEILAHLFAATTGSDSDWVVKLIDVYPDAYEPARLGGFELMIAEEVFRGRYRASFERPEPIPRDTIQQYDISLRSRDHTFKAGHRIMVQIQSTWFPLIDRNPQTFVQNIYEAKQGDFQVATQSIYRSRANASYLTLPLAAK